MLEIKQFVLAVENQLLNQNNTMSKEIALNESTMQKALDFAYDKATNGIKGLDSAQELAKSYMNTDESLDKQVNNLIKWQNAKAGTSGFVTGLGGIITMPVTLPANITSVLFVQIRMIAAIAYMGGYDLKDDKVKTFVYACLVGSSATEIIKKAGIEVGKKLAINAIKNISGKTILKINQAIGFRLITKFGDKGILNLGKTVPVLGGVIGGTVDTISTNMIGKTAKKLFISVEEKT